MIPIMNESVRAPSPERTMSPPLITTKIPRRVTPNPSGQILQHLSSSSQLAAASLAWFA